MEQESYDYILNIEHRPNKTAVLIALPMYMYRVEMARIDYGVNFFQKAVLMFKSKPGMKNETIASLLGLDMQLVNIVSEELANKKLIEGDGLLTAKGIEMREHIDEPIVDQQGTRAIGYIFQHLNDDGLYAFYVNHIEKASVIGGDICTGNKGETGDEDFYATPVTAAKLLDDRVINPFPTEREIIGVIRRSNRHNYSEDDTDIINVDDDRYGIKFVNDKPEVVWVCAYVYLPRIKDEVYSSEWAVADPFGYENNPELRRYINDLLVNGYIEDFTQGFRNYQTLGGETIDSFLQFMANEVEKELGESFDIGFVGLDKSLQSYIKNVIKYYILLCRYPETDTSSGFLSNIQMMLETILKIDFEKNEKPYRKLGYAILYSHTRNGEPNDFHWPQKRSEYLEELTYTGKFTISSDNLRRMMKFAKDFNPKNLISLKHYVIEFLFAYKYNAENPLYSILKDYISNIYDVADMRNKTNHGNLGKEGGGLVLEKEKIQAYYTMVKQIANDYIRKYNV